MALKPALRPPLRAPMRGANAPREGVGGFSLDAYMASLSDGFYFDTTKTDRFFQEDKGPTLADDVGEAMGLAMDQRSWGGLTLSALIAAAPELESNGNFASDTVWTKGANWTIAGGKATKSAGAANNLTDSTRVAVVGRTYRVEFTIENYGGAGALTPTMGANGTARTANGTYVEYITATGATALALAGGTSFSGDVKNVSVKLVSGNHGLQATGTLKPVRQTTGAKFDGSDDNWLTPYLASTGNNFTVALVTMPASVASFQAIAGAGGNPTRFFVGVDTDGRLKAGVGANSITTIQGTNDLRGQTLVVGLSCDGSTVRLFEDAAEVYTGVQSGVPTVADSIRIGSNNAAGTAIQWFSGSIKRIAAGRDALTLARYQQIRTALLAA